MMYVRLWEGKPGTGLVRVPTVNHRGSTPDAASCNAIISKDSISAYYRLNPIITA